MLDRWPFQLTGSIQAGSRESIPCASRVISTAINSTAIFVTRTVYAVVPPRVEYAITPLGESLSEAFCGVWLWAEANYAELERQRAAYLKRMTVSDQVRPDPPVANASVIAKSERTSRP
jgi:HxlR-like helix-turn-helix